MLGAFADAEDVVQDVLLRAWRSRATYAGDAPLEHWLMRIATNTCLNALTRGAPRRLPQLEREPTEAWIGSEELEASLWVTPAPDGRLFPDPAGAAEAREQVALAFIALLQRLSPKQRAALLLKDVVGWTAEEIAAVLDLSAPAVNSALHRARETMATHVRAPADEPSPEVLTAYVRSWETRDLDGLVALLRQDVIFAMPPHAIWLRGRDAVRGLLLSPRFSAFWARGLRATHTRASGLPALAWYWGGHEDGVLRLHSIHVMRFESGALAEAINFIGPHYVRGFGLPATLRQPE
jgi:RNA polymerase sigma-70 factor, ECF subfamily